MSDDDPYSDDPPATSEELARAESFVDAWLCDELASNPVVVAVDRVDTEYPRWYVRLLGEEKDTFAVWLALRQRSLYYETYVMPAPEENHAQFYEHLLRRNQKLVGAAFAIGAEDAVFLQGSIPVGSIGKRALDHVLGVLYVTVEQSFRPALRIGFASHFKKS